MSDPDPNRKKVILPFFGIDIAENRCMRNSYKYAVPSALFPGLGIFLFTSNMRKSVMGGLFCGATVFLLYFNVCAYQEFREQLQRESFQRMETNPTGAMEGD